MSQRCQRTRRLVWWCIPVITELGRVRQEDSMFRMGYVVRAGETAEMSGQLRVLATFLEDPSGSQHPCREAHDCYTSNSRGSRGFFLCPLTLVLCDTLTQIHKNENLSQGGDGASQQSEAGRSRSSIPAWSTWGVLGHSGI